ncbi:hypothetical protein VCHA53O466_50063 [Vibrio chagasii]|nr:hypothetical protein VCHA53O466_50063 [Vibrio chagasii]
MNDKKTLNNTRLSCSHMLRNPELIELLIANNSLLPRESAFLIAVGSKNHIAADSSNSSEIEECLEYYKKKPPKISKDIESSLIQFIINHPNMCEVVPQRLLTSNVLKAFLSAPNNVNLVWLGQCGELSFELYELAIRHAPWSIVHVPSSIKGYKKLRYISDFVSIEHEKMAYSRIELEPVLTTSRWRARLRRQSRVKRLISRGATHARHASDYKPKSKLMLSVIALSLTGAAYYVNSNYDILTLSQEVSDYIQGVIS